MNNSLSDKLQIWGFEDSFIIFKDGSLGFGFEVNPTDASTWDSEQINTLGSQLDQFLNGLPAGLDLQFIQEIRPGNNSVLQQYQKAASSCPNSNILKLVNHRVNHLKNLDDLGRLPCHRLKVFVRRPLSGPLIKKHGPFTKTELFPEFAENVLLNELKNTDRLRESIQRGLDSIGLTASPLSQIDIMKEVYSQWNPSRPIGLGEYDPENVTDSLLFTDVVTSDSGFSLGDIHFRLLTLKNLPDVTITSMTQVLRELPFNSKLFVTVHVPDQQKEYETLQTQRRIAFSMARGKRSGVADLESEAKLQDIETLLASLIAQGEKVFHMSLQVLLQSSDEEVLATQVSQTLSKLRELSGAEAMQETIASFDLFQQISIPNARTKERTKKIKTTNLTDFLPVYGPWKGHENATALLRSRLGSLLAFDPFSKSLTNHNMLVSGGSGSGKSFFTNILLLQFLKENPKIFIVDIGGSYRRLCSLLGGQYIELGLDTNMSLNPFDLPKGEIHPSGEKIKFLLSLVETMTKEENADRLSKLERAEIEESIAKCYEKFKKPRLSNLKDFLLEHTDVNIRRLGRILTTWTGDTTYGKFLDRDTSIELSKNLISFDLKGLDNHPDLQAVCLFIITDLVWREVQMDRITKKILVFDECWRLLESDSGASFIGDVFRTFRKYYAGVVAISQDIDDFAKSKVSGAILPNSSSKWILMQKGADQQRLKEVLQLKDVELQLISTLFQEKGKFSEAFLIAGDSRSVVAVEPTSLEYWLATTDPRDLAYFEEIKKQNPDKSDWELVEIAAAIKPHGASQKGS